MLPLSVMNQYKLYPEILEECKSCLVRIADSLKENQETLKSFSYSSNLNREMKAEVDTFIERELLRFLSKYNFPILSEESGLINSDALSGNQFIIDPLDGTFNFVRGLGICSISLALWNDFIPIFGIVYSLLDRKMYWGGKLFGAFYDGSPISVSDISDLEDACVCSGFPVRFDLNDESKMLRLFNKLKKFKKVRMLGSASISIANVAKGSADCYFEEQIMLWDVAAALAILEGAGGSFQILELSKDWKCSVYASNKNLSPKFIQ